MFKYSHAVVSRIPLSLRTRGVEIDVAKKEFEAYVQLLRELELDVIEMPQDEDLPESVFIEDTAVVCNNIALITKPNSAARQKEVENVRAILRKELDLAIVEIADPKAKLEGGDVLFTGKEFFVGISEFTNEGGARAVANAFPEFPCCPIKVTEKRHLKYYVTMAGPDLLCISNTTHSQEILKRIEREATFSYQTLTLSEENAANVLHINGHLVHRSIDEIPVSHQILSEKIDMPRKVLNFTELGKYSSGLCSCCILIKRSRYIRNL
ncbi:hypothetical protein PVAND_002882 [Polypedilum vanderplanki]|uniref:Dimethylargininase n=1 Tax=Polypedilum vanderplanki TaxID=319348 RepID=A0A9J6BSF0_POLVA|nr:hypothetical protein PVAND_002882 [Polypedilum vanderplanki]